MGAAGTDGSLTCFQLRKVGLWACRKVRQRAGRVPYQRIAVRRDKDSKRNSQFRVLVKNWGVGIKVLILHWMVSLTSKTVSLSKR